MGLFLGHGELIGIVLRRLSLLLIEQCSAGEIEHIFKGLDKSFVYQAIIGLDDAYNDHSALCSNIRFAFFVYPLIKLKAVFYIRKWLQVSCIDKGNAVRGGKRLQHAAVCEYINKFAAIEQQLIFIAIVEIDVLRSFQLIEIELVTLVLGDVEDCKDVFLRQLGEIVDRVER